MKARLTSAFALAALAAGLLCAPAAADTKTPAERLEAYKVAIATGDPAASEAFLKDEEAVALAEAAEGGAQLRAKAVALKDLKDLLSMSWDRPKANMFSEALAIRTTADKPLCKVSLCPAPENLVPWMDKYLPKSPAAKKEALKFAIRRWDVVFGTATASKDMSWGQASQRNGNGVSFTKADWEGWTITERNSVLSRLMAREPAFMIYDDETLARTKGDMSLLQTVDKVKSSGILSETQMDQLAGKSFEDQLYLLGNMFDGGGVKVSDDIRMRISAARDSLPKEVLPAQQRTLLGGMLTTAMPGELAGTKAGDRVNNFYAANGGMKIEIRPCDGQYSRFDEASGTIILDSETIQQYMRMKGYTSESVMRSKEQVADIAKYMSPMVVYEGAHHMQSAWARSAGVYKPRVQEDEIEAMSLEGLYTTEKIGKDPAFKKQMDETRSFSTYASKRVEIATEFRGSGAKKFASTVRQRYFSGLPSLDAAAAQVLGAVSGELERRAGLSAPERADIDATGIPLAEALEMQPEELCGSVGEVQSGALKKIQKDLGSMGVYTSHYGSSENQTRDALKGLKTASAAPKKGAVPAL